MNSEVTQISNIVDIENISAADASLLSSKDLVRAFGNPGDYIEMHIYSPDGTLISSDYDFKGYNIPSTTQGLTTTDIIFNPNTDVFSKGYLTGTFNVQYNILKHQITTGSSAAFFIKEISTDRTEIRISSNVISNDDLETNSINLISDIVTAPYFKDFLLDFGSNSFLTGVNIALDKSTSPYSLLIKLYQPLPNTHAINDAFWIVEELSNSYTYEVSLTPDEIVSLVPMLRGPNFDLDIDHLQTPPTKYYNYNSILGILDTGSYQNLINLMSTSGVQLNIDYTDFSNFIHFSSAEKRLLNFYSKVQLLESYNRQIQTLGSVTSSFSVSRSISSVQSNINDLITNFDGYDNFLYSVSSSLSWPKSNSTLPYTLYPSTSSQVVNWLGSVDSFSPIFGGMLYSSSFYDQENQNNLIHSVPEYILIDQTNDPLSTFYQMIGQHFDSIWTYIKAAGDIYKANNSLTKGISKDLVFYALRSMGIKLYNKNSDQSLVEYYTGRTSSGSFLPATSSYEKLVTASQYTISGQDQVKEIFKRIYHNVPYILKTKGTDASFRAISSLYGVPSTIFRTNEYGGVDKQSDTIEYAYDRFSYALSTKGSGSFTAPWAIVSQSFTSLGTGSFATSIEFRFKPDVNSFVTNPTQSLVFIGNGGGTSNIYLLAQYSQSNGLPYAQITFGLNGVNGFIYGSPMSLPLFVTQSNGDTRWWNVLLKKRFQSFISGSADWIDFDDAYFIDAADNFRIDTGYGSPLFDTGSQFFDVYIKNQINGKIGHQASSSIFIDVSSSASYNGSWDNNSTLYIGGVQGSPSPIQSIFVGKLQEVRLWDIPLSESAFNWHVLNPESIEGNYSSSYYRDLAARFPLGNNLFTYDHSISASVVSLQTDAFNSQFPSGTMINFGPGNSYVPNYETYYANVPIAGYSNPVTDKIRIIGTTITGSVISNYIRLEQPLSSSLTRDLHVVNAAYSPQNEIDQDIIGALGGTIDLDDYIGDPADETRASYFNLDKLKTDFFNERYITRYDYNAYIRLIKYFDNTLFKTLQDFIAGRANLEVGVSIRPTLIERAKVKRYNPVFTITPLSASIKTYDFRVSRLLDTRVGDNSAAINGVFSGSWIDNREHFRIANYNPYLVGDGRADLNRFPGSAFDVLYGNVSHNVTSSKILKVDLNKNLIPMEVQDSYYTNLSQTRARYEGSKTVSQFYNTYSLGDIVYDKTSAISANALKFAWVKQINATNLNFFDKTTISIKYLVDNQGSLLDLSRHNLNLFEVQNTFKSGTPVIVSLSDVNKPSNQTALDGDKMIFEGGFSYWPLVFRESGESMTFDYINSITNSGSINITMIQTASFEYTTNPTADSTIQVYRQIDMDTSLGGYTLTFNNNKLSSGQFALNYIAPFASWSYATNSDLKETGTVAIGSGSSGTRTIGTDANQFVYQVNPAFVNYNTVTSNDAFSNYAPLDDGTYAFHVPRSSSYNVNINIPFNLSMVDNVGGGTIVKAVAILEKNIDPVNIPTWSFVDRSMFTYIEQGVLGANYGWQSQRSLMQLDNDTFNGGADSPLKVMMTITGSYNFNANDYVRVSIFIIRLNNFLPTGGVNNARISVKNRFFNSPINVHNGILSFTDSLNSSITPITGSTYNQNTFFSITGSTGNQLVFSDSASILYNKIIFNESNDTIAQNYSPIIYPFTFQVGDILRLTSYYTQNPTYYTVTGVTTPITGSDLLYVTSSLGQNVTRSLLVTLDKPVTSSNAISSKFVIFRRTPDETSVILNFNKTPGVTSQAVLIPWDLDSDVHNQVANLVSQLTPQLSSTLTSTSGST